MKGSSKLFALLTSVSWLLVFTIRLIWGVEIKNYFIWVPTVLSGLISAALIGWFSRDVWEHRKV